VHVYVNVCLYVVHVYVYVYVCVYVGVSERESARARERDRDRDRDREHRRERASAPREATTQAREATTQPHNHTATQLARSQSTFSSSLPTSSPRTKYVELNSDITSTSRLTAKRRERHVRERRGKDAREGEHVGYLPCSSIPAPDGLMVANVNWGRSILITSVLTSPPLSVIRGECDHQKAGRERACKDSRERLSRRGRPSCRSRRI
jgi:hypothetical protein